MGKECSVFNIFNAVVGTSTFTSSVTSVLYRDDIGYQINFTGTPAGVIQFNGSNDYNPQTPQSGNLLGSSQTGNWFTFASVSGAAISSPYALNINQFPFAFIQCQVGSMTSALTCNGFVSTKSVGS